jgi:DNA-binding NarL/FixJ family response regulator
MSNALRARAREIDRSRQPGDRDDPTRIWNGIIAGKWFIVDRFDEDGRRYVIARVNTVPQRLTARERRVLALAARGDSNKVIAYELGVSITTVSTEVSRIMVKLGLESRCELVATLGGLARRVGRPRG